VATTPTLRPLGVGEILDAGIKLYVRHWKPLMICVAGIVLPVQILSVLVMASIDSSSLDTFGSGSTPATGDTASGAEIAAVIAVALASGLSTLLATAACFKAVSDAWLGATPEAGRSLRFGARRLPALIGLSIVMGAGLVLAFIALIIPSIWLFVSWSLAVPVLLFERVGAFKALRRSFSLVRRRWWATFGALLVGYLLASIVAGIVQLIPEGIASGVANDSVVAEAIAAVVGGTVSAMISTPYTAAILTLLYFDQRVRKEGFDLQLLADGLGTARDPDAPLPAPLVGPEYTEEQRAAAPYWPPPPGWVPPDPSPPAEERQWWKDPAPASPVDEAARYAGGYARPQAPDSGASPPSGPASPPSGPASPPSGPASPPAAASSSPAAGPPPPAPGAPSPLTGGDPLQGAAGADSPAAGEPEPPPADQPKRDRDRADWLPPEAPRGPSGL
jgi:hypothetical protein